MIDLNLLNAFVAVAQSSSFSLAAKKLRLPKSSVSRAISRLEAELDTQLLHRTTRQVSLTTAGAALYEKVTPSIASLAQAVGSIPERDQQPAGELRITAPVDVGHAFLAEVVARFVARYPMVRVDARITNEIVDLVGDGFDLALRAAARRLEDSTLVARKLSPVEFHVFAAPSYLARRGTPRTVEDLDAHDWVGFRPRTRDPIRARSRIIADDLMFVREAIRMGAGLGMFPSFLARSDVASGALVRVVPRHAEPAGGLMLVYPKTQHPPLKVTAFRDFVVEYLSANPLVPRAE